MSEDSGVQPLRALIARQVGRPTLGERECRELFRELLPFTDAVTCTSAEEVERAASAFAGPVVIKALSVAYPHKSEHGLVEICADSAAARLAAKRLLTRIEGLDRPADFVLSTQPRLTGIEVSIGIRRDLLGPTMVVAAGGTLVEIHRDVAVRMAPVEADEATEMLHELRAWPLFAGFRGAGAADVGAIVALIVTLSRLAAEIPEVAEMDLNPVLVLAAGCRVADAICSVAAPPPAEAERRPAVEALQRILRPRRVAVIGASSDASKVGGLLVRYLRHRDWGGEIIAVKRGSAIDGIRTVPNLRGVKGSIDLACIAVPATAVEAAIEDCVAAGVSAGIVFSAGFAEAGPAGVQAQQRLLRSAGHSFRFAGPNTIGVATPPESFFATFGMAFERPVRSGAVALISQSGAIASSLISRSAELDLGFSHWVSTGNEADLDVADYIEYLVEDNGTSVIGMFLEAIRRPLAFAHACQLARDARKPLVAVKVGRSEAGRAAAFSHTGAIAGQDAAYSAFLRRCGVISTPDLPALVAALHGLTSAGAIAGRRVVIVSTSGGACSLLADACVDAGLHVPNLTMDTQRRLRGVIPAFGGVTNPIDVTASAVQDPGLLERTLEIVADSQEADLALVQLSTNADPAAVQMANALVALRDAGRMPLLVGRLGSPDLAPAGVARYKAADLHIFSWPGELAAAARACAEYGLLVRQTTTVGNGVPVGHADASTVSA